MSVFQHFSFCLFEFQHFSISAFQHLPWQFQLVRLTTRQAGGTHCPTWEHTSGLWSLFSACQRFSFSAFARAGFSFCFSDFCFLLSQFQSFRLSFPGRQAGRTALLGNTLLISDICFQPVNMSAFQRFRVSVL